MKEPQIYTPDTRWITKSYVSTTILLVFILLCTVPFGLLMGADVNGQAGMLNGLWIAVAINLLWYIPLMIIIRPYYNRLRYEIHEDEVIVHIGLITQSVKHVPFRTVTNIEVKRGPLDRLFGIATLNIQTAGASGSTTAEETLAGLADVDEVYDRVARALRRFRSALSPDQAGEDEPHLSDSEVMWALLDEVRKIHAAIRE